eukprot:TRINITY_DN7636_c0_g1_i2.p1 TRINITY_DN7636_c0_g1~~TRINITY_DN7636_c0_g1_i2.p1  ORF type:complete len:509 (+),score=99.06 TRINITY_DN7636_c0_g1_i2:55-1581(+)
MEAKTLHTWFKGVLADQRATLLSEISSLHEEALCELREYLEATGGDREGPLLVKPKAVSKSGGDEVHVSDSVDNTISTNVCADSTHVSSESPQELATPERRSAVPAAPDLSCLQELMRPSRLVHTTGFEMFFSVFIILNMLFMIVEAQYGGHVVGSQLGYQGYTTLPKEEVDKTDQAFYVIGMVFGVIFLLEQLMKLAGEQWAFWKSAWNYFDLLLNSLWVLVDVFQVQLSIKPSILRLLRLLRLLRWLRLARQMASFDALVLMSTALRSSLSVMFWAFVMLASLQVMLALVFYQVIQLWITDDDISEDDRKQLFDYFGNYSRCMLTMFEITLGNWIPVARLLQEEVSEFLIFFSILHKCTMGFAVIGVINGVFMQETLKAARHDHTLMVRQAENEQKSHWNMMQEFFHQAHQASTGGISKKEFEKVLEDPHMKAWFAAQELSVTDVDRIFDMMSNNGVELTPETLSAGVLSLKGSAKSLDLHRVMLDQQAIKADLAALLEQINRCSV